jgi:dTDP-glucose pyrophosphorylase
VGEYHLAEKLSAWAPGSKIVQIDGLTDGAARTVLAASHFINNDEPLMIANSDQWIDIDIEHYLDLQDKRGLDGLIMTMTADDPKWSYVQVERNGLASKVVEKKVISNEATVGIYNFARGSDFVSAASEMIAVDDRSNGEFYVAPVYNYMIEDGAAIGIENIGTEGSGMYGLGIPEDLEAFYRLPVCERAIARIAA